ncbi:fatty acid desaturase family protein [Candidatus Cyanaurora vandensis]|uniref:fatty acid desaturase family protein n=1 Tax=Candidatus Cyanaurora vandensis TaxID=2714958 RepID=UPI0037C07A6A
MNSVDRQIQITQAEYVKKLRPLLPDEAFLPSFNKVWILLINVVILILGWGTASYLDQWSWYLLWLYLPLTLVMANSVIVLLFSTHNLLHSSAIRNSYLRQIISLLGLALLWMPPTLWKVVHNREHHTKTNSRYDPDRSYLYEQPKTWGKWLQNLFVPSTEVHPLFLSIGLGHAWGVHTLRNLSSVLFFNNGLTRYSPAAFKVSAKERGSIALELLIIIGIHLSILSYLQFDPVKLILSYFLPIWIGYGGILFYVYTNHMLCPMTALNDPLVNSLSLRVPKLFNLLHFNFSYHTEHHIFPGMNSDYYPLVQELLKTLYPDRFNLLDARAAWLLLLRTPRHYQDEQTFTNWSGKNSLACPLLHGDGLIQDGAPQDRC